MSAHHVQHAHCSYCGTRYQSGAPWPRLCAGCDQTTWRNPLPVAVILLPVRTDEGMGLVVVRRDIEPARGELALPGGFIEVGETWQQAATRELAEETGLIGDPTQVSLFHVESTTHTLNIFGLLPPRPAAGMPESAPTDEVTEWLIITGPQPLAFPTHDDVVGRYFASA